MTKIILLLLTSLLATVTVAQAPAPIGAGPFPAAIISDPTLPTHTIYIPADLDALGGEKLPIVAWGNGACVNANFNYREFLAEVASHGFMVVALGPYRERPLPPPDRSGTPDQWAGFETNTGQMINGINWAISMSDMEGSVYAGHIDTSNIAVMGHSCGGLQALESSFDRRVTTLLVLNSGLFDEGDVYMQRFSVDRSMLAGIQIPTGYFIGGETDIAYANSEKDWPLIQAPSVNANMDVGHGGTYQMPGGGPFAEAPLAWLKWQTKDDRDAAAMFLGADCGLCINTGWTLKKRGID